MVSLQLSCDASGSALSSVSVISICMQWLLSATLLLALFFSQFKKKIKKVNKNIATFLRDIWKGRFAEWDGSRDN